MNKFLLIALMSFVSIHSSFAQEDGDKLVKKAKKSLTSYFYDTKDVTKLTEAKNFIDEASKDAAVVETATYLVTKGEVYNQLSQIDLIGSEIAKNMSTEYKQKYSGAANIAFNAFLKALEKNPKAGEKGDALTGLTEVASGLSMDGLNYFYAQDYAKSYENFNAMLQLHEVLKANKKSSPLEKPEDLNNQYYITGLAAYSNNDLKTAGMMYEKAYSSGHKTAEVYDGLFRSFGESDPAKAEKYLTEGRADFPNDNNLLFSEINYYLKQNKLDNLIDKLKLAVEKEPENISVLNTLGNVYDKLYQQYNEGGEQVKAAEFLTQAENTYKQAIKKDPKNVFALYSLGTLHYNKAAGYYQDLKKLEDDMSAAGTKKYNEVDAKIKSEFEMALPYFEQAVAIDPTDKNTLLALREIYARSNNLEKSKQYGDMLDKLK